MNTAKLKAAGLLLDESYATDESSTEEKFMILTARDNAALLNEVPATSSDFKGAFGGEWRDGKLTRLLGWRFIHMELRNPNFTAFKRGLTVDASGFTKNLFWTKSGIRKGVWRKLRTAIKDQPSKVDTRSVFAGTTVGATRTEAGKVGIVLNTY